MGPIRPVAIRSARRPNYIRYPFRDLLVFPGLRLPCIGGAIIFNFGFCGGQFLIETILYVIEIHIRSFSTDILYRFDPFRCVAEILFGIIYVFFSVPKSLGL